MSIFATPLAVVIAGVTIAGAIYLKPVPGRFVTPADNLALQVDTQTGEVRECRSETAPVAGFSDTNVAYLRQHSTEPGIVDSFDKAFGKGAAARVLAVPRQHLLCRSLRDW